VTTSDDVVLSINIFHRLIIRFQVSSAATVPSAMPTACLSPSKRPSAADRDLCHTDLTDLTDFKWWWIEQLMLFHPILRGYYLKQAWLIIP